MKTIYALSEYILYKPLMTIPKYAIYKSNQQTLSTLMLLADDGWFDDFKDYIINLPNTNFGTNCTSVKYIDGVVIIASLLNVFPDHSTDFVTTVPKLLDFLQLWEVVYKERHPYVLVVLDEKEELHIQGYENEMDLPQLSYTKINKARCL